MSRYDDLRAYTVKLEDRIAELQTKLEIANRLNKEAFDSIRYLEKKIALYEMISKLSVKDQELLFNAMSRIL